MERGKRQRGEKTKEIIGFLDVCKRIYIFLEIIQAIKHWGGRLWECCVK
jgi:hypothetical protein